MKKHLHVIQSIVPGSIAEEMELQPGDTVLAINGQDIEDVFDYHYLVNDEYIEMLIRTADGTEEVLEIEKDYGPCHLRAVLAVIKNNAVSMFLRRIQNSV